MATLTKFNCFVKDLADGKHELYTDVLKLCLTNVAPALTAADYADLSGEVAPGNGYSAGGTNLVKTYNDQVGGLYKYVVDDATFAASGGTIGPFRYGVVYNDTADTILIGFIDRGSSYTIPDGQSFTFDFGPDGLLSIQ